MKTEKAACKTFLLLIKNCIQKINKIENFVNKPIDQKIVTNYHKISTDILKNYVQMHYSVVVAETTKSKKENCSFKN